MKDEEIIKALGMCNAENCDSRICPYGTYGEDIFLCTPKLTEDALDLINRQQAEIDRLKKYNTDVAYKHYDDGIKEFAEKLKAEHSTPDILMPFNWISIEDTALDQLVAEMVGADNDYSNNSL